MPLTHWTDDAIQDYLDGGRNRRSGLWAEHLRQCDSCREKLRQYRALYRFLAVEPAWTLGKDFASATAARARKRPSLLAWLSMESVWIPAGLALGFIAWLVLVAPAAWTEGVKSLWTAVADCTGSLADPIEDGLNRYRGYFRWFVQGACVLVAVAGIDGLLLRLKQRRIHA